MHEIRAELAYSIIAVYFCFVDLLIRLQKSTSSLSNLLVAFFSVTFKIPNPGKPFVTRFYSPFENDRTMRTNGPKNEYSRSLYFILFVLLFLISKFGIAQPDYVFRNPTLLTGSSTDKKVGAKYRFDNVKTGTDAFVTITDMTGGVKLTALDGGSGYDEAFQPSIDIPALGSGYVEFLFEFVKHGTSTAQTQIEVPITPIDVDGIPLQVSEFDMIEQKNGYTQYNMLGIELAFSLVNNVLGGVWAQGTNIAGIDYPGVDTSARQVMYTVTNANISSFTIRNGGTNLSLSTKNRLRSVYFKKFTYNNAVILAKSSLSDFAGIKKDKKVELSWNLETGTAVKSVVVEKSGNTANDFTAIGEVWITTESNTSHYAFNDNNASGSVAYYRLKIVSANGQVSYSNVLAFRLNETKQQFKMYPSVINDNATVNLNAAKAEQTTVQVVDLSGRTVFSKNISLQQGDNNIAINGLSNLHNGTYVAWIKAGDAIYSQKLMIQ